MCNSCEARIQQEESIVTKILDRQIAGEQETQHSAQQKRGDVCPTEEKHVPDKTHLDRYLGAVPTSRRKPPPVTLRRSRRLDVNIGFQLSRTLYARHLSSPRPFTSPPPGRPRQFPPPSPAGSVPRTPQTAPCFSASPEFPPPPPAAPPSLLPSFPSSGRDGAGHEHRSP